MNAIIDFLSFKLFITPSLLVVMYYLGAIIMPIMSWFFVKWLQQKHPYFYVATEVSKQQYVNHVETKHRILLWAIALIFFVMLEIVWRMMFEFFIAYFQMHDALLRMQIK